MIGSSFTIGIDIGKTKIAAGLVDATGTLDGRIEVATDLSNGAATAMPQVLDVGRRLLGEASSRHVTGVGVGSTGVVDAEAGVLVSSGSIANWDHVPLAQMLMDEFGMPARVDNDVYAAGLGEAMYGAGREAQSCVYITVSTGIGFCHVVDGHVRRGEHGLVGQIAHLPLIGAAGTINSAASGAGIAATAGELLGREVSTVEVFERARDGDGPAVDVIAGAATALGRLIAWIQCTADPVAIVVGGSVANRQPEFMAAVREQATDALAKYDTQLDNGEVPIRLSELEDDAGVIGGAALARLV